jgi:hypothetical protein
MLAHTPYHVRGHGPCLDPNYFWHPGADVHSGGDEMERGRVVLWPQDALLKGAVG